MTNAIEINNLSKKYLLYHEGENNGTTFVDILSFKAKQLYKRIRRPFEPVSQPLSSREQFWALKDVSFEIKEGDRVGIIGRNGAGKSTLLKILSRITEPTTGTIKIRGRCSSLLEVSTGFHPELTGRENIYLNGAILGMKRSEITRKFDEIVAFSEVEQFLDTPVKRFSSGMYMRLGFAIAAHLDSDILIIDEVLAVGDVQFQSKCFHKLNDLGMKGRTVLFVSHDLGSVLSLCNRGIYLKKGRVVASGEMEACANRYMQHYRDKTLRWSGEVGDEHIRIFQVSLDSEKQFFYQGEKPLLTIDYELTKPHPELFMGVGVWNMRHQLLAQSHTFEDKDKSEQLIRPGVHRLSFALDAALFHEGEYLVKLQCAILNKKKICDEDIVLKFPVYAQEKNTRFAQAFSKDGISLGRAWEWAGHR